MSELVTEKVLIEAAVGGDSLAVERLLLIHFSALERHIELKIPAKVRRHFSAEDVLQHVFSQVFQDVARFQTRGDGSFRAWLKAIADHRLADTLKKLGRKKCGGHHHQLSVADVEKAGTIASLIDMVCHDSHLPDQSAARHEAEKAIQVAVAMLPADQREVLRARFFEGKTVEDIAHETGRTEGAVRGLIHRAKEKLRAAFGRSSDWLSRR